tara:strand:- start:135 stop:374 length:240 start_codon:yes stop_codon:yes gene_type:complete
MKKIIITLCLILFSSSAYAGSCPMLAAKFDKMIESATDDKIIEEAKELRDKGVKAHDGGDHPRSVILLNKALKLLKAEK